jgi:hypothetical protein
MKTAQPSRSTEPRPDNGLVASGGWRGLIRLLLLVCIAFYVPPGLIMLGIIPFSMRFWVLVATAAGLAVYARFNGTSLRQLGIRADTLGGSLVANAILSTAVITALGLAYSYGAIRAPTVPTWSLFFPLYVGLFCPAQEFTCRAVLFAEFERVGFIPPGVQILLSAVTYAFIHIIYGDLLILTATLAIGIAWGTIYLHYPNLWGVTLSHAVIGVVSILVGLV